MEATTSTFEWDGVMETPERKEEAAQRYAKEQKALADKRRAEKESALCRFREKQQVKRKQRVEIRSVRYAICALTAAVVAWLFSRADLTWAVWISGIAGFILAMISAYGAGMHREMGRK